MFAIPCARLKPSRFAESIAGLIRFVVIFLTIVGAAGVHAELSDPGAPAALRSKYDQLKPQLNSNQFKRPIHLNSTQAANELRGDMHAVINHPFATVNAALNGPSQWCDILILHLNTKYCRPATIPQGTLLRVKIGKKHDQPVSDAYPVDFIYRVAATTSNYLQVLLNADSGPLGTRDYRIVLEAVPLDSKSTFIHLSYSYGFGTAGKLAMQVYLSTIGSDKVGFTVKSRQPDGDHEYIDGIRGLIERNTMRYYLAIESYLGALSSPPQLQLEKRLRDWFSAVERYPRQLHELEETEYMEMKRKEYSRQQQVES